ncbi:MAG: Uma2 family endonuclease [Elainellaceae cyanobacterium]
MALPILLSPFHQTTTLNLKHRHAIDAATPPAMIANPQPQAMSVADYLAWEPQQDLRYEFVWGQVQAMTGGTIAHNLIALNLYSTIRSSVRTQGCRAFVADVKAQVNAAGLYRYPDLMVSCDERDRGTSSAIRFPKLIVEVLSPSTEGIDRGDKFAEYRQLATLEEYVLISAEKVSVECFRRREGSFWLYQPYSEGEDIALESISFACSAAQLYDDVEFGAS